MKLITLDIDNFYSLLAYKLPEHYDIMNQVILETEEEDDLL